MSRPSDAPRMIAGGALLLSSSTFNGQTETGEDHVASEQSTEPERLAGIVSPTSVVDTNVLVVEDERIVGLHLRQQLVKLGYKVTAVVSSGGEAMMAVTRQPPDVVLMDIHIDGPIDGIDTAKQIRTTHTLPVIYLTAFSGEATLERAKATKPYGYLLKPFSERELHATIQMAMERSREDHDAREREDRLLIALGLANGSRVWC